MVWLTLFIACDNDKPIVSDTANDDNDADDEDDDRDDADDAEDDDWWQDPDSLHWYWKDEDGTWHQHNGQNPFLRL